MSARKRGLGVTVGDGGVRAAVFVALIGLRKLGVVKPTIAGFFFQAEDGIRDLTVTGVQTCALPIYADTVDDRLHASSRVGNPSLPGLCGLGLERLAGFRVDGTHRGVSVRRQSRSHLDRKSVV